ncbi:MAG: glycosyltransferase [Microgenomates group bacterium]|nr:glycosyltransferase [Microgenomates group bacterium]
MRIGFLLPSIYASNRYSEGRIFAPKDIAVTLVNRLVEKGHQVLFYTSSDVVSNATVIGGDERLTNTDPFYFQFRYRDLAEQKYATFEIIKRDFEYDLTIKAYQDALSGKLDIIQSFHDFGAHYFNELTKFPTVYVLHDPLPQDENTIEYLRLSKFTHHDYISISDSQRKGVVKLNFIKTIHHGLKIDEFAYSENADNYLIHFGRILEDKGSDLAVKVALETGNTLRIATSNIRANRSAKFYDQTIAPFIDGKKIILEGYYTGEAKSNYIKKAKAFLFPLKWEEPFGLVMIESMACGTPVVAFARGSVPEVIKDGETGFIVNFSETDIRGDWIVKKTGFEGLCEAVERIYSMPEEQYRQMRRACRAHVEKNFTVERMADEYEKVYQQIINLKK